MSQTRKRSRHFGRRARRGLNLIEVMVTVAIIAMFSGVASVIAYKMMQDAQVHAAEVEVKAIGDALHLYQVKRLRYPTTGEGLKKLVEAELLKSVDADPWGNAYVYLQPGQKNPKTFDLYSKGPDGQEATEDDIEQ